MNRKAFTLIELLMVILIMGILGSITVGGYRAMQRGMEERGVMENVNHFLRSAYRRAQIDRQPVAVFYWNETLRAETENDTLIVVGKAVAVRRAGRISRVIAEYLYDEFADLDKERLIVDDEDLEGGNDNEASTQSENLMPFYQMTSRNRCKRLLASQNTQYKPIDERSIIFGSAVAKIKRIPCYAYKLEQNGGWETGDAYGFEFAEIQLPHGYIFGSDKPPERAGEISAVKSIWFDLSGNAEALQIYSLRPGESGQLEAQVVATSDKPTEGIH